MWCLRVEMGVKQYLYWKNNLEKVVCCNDEMENERSFLRMLTQQNRIVTFFFENVDSTK